MGKVMNQTAHMTAAASAEATFSCADNTAMTLDTTLLVSILFALLSLRLRALFMLVRSLLVLSIPHKWKGAVPIFA